MEREIMTSYLVCHEAVECEGALTVDSVLAYHLPSVRCLLVVRLEPIRHPLVYNLLVARLMGG